MTKKILLLLIILVTIMCCSCSNNSTNKTTNNSNEETKTSQNKQADCKHDFAQKTINKKTCTTDGIISLTCKKCNFTTKKTDYSSGHEWVNANCTEPKHCSICNEKEGEALTYKHNFNNNTCTLCGFVNSQTKSCNGVNFILPIDYFCDRYNGFIFKINDITFEDSYDTYSYFYINYDVTRVLTESSYNEAEDVHINFTLYDENGYVISTGGGYTKELLMGETSKSDYIAIKLDHMNGIDLLKGHTYTLKFRDE